MPAEIHKRMVNVRPSSRPGFSRGGRSRISRDYWEVLYCRYSPVVRAYFISRGLRAEDADDLTQELFVALTQRKSPRDPRVYIGAMARSMVRQHRRLAARAFLRQEGYRRFQLENSPGIIHVRETAPSAANETPEEFMQRAAARLPREQYKLLRLKFVENLRIREIARRMACSESAAYKRLHRARNLLRHLGQKEKDGK